MAEFKLGRLRFVWKNQWVTGTTYFQDDVIAYGGKIYICVTGHTASADFFDDFDIVPPKWNLVSDGQTWKTGWEPQAEYIPGDIVKYGARLYICQEKHTSAIDSTTGLEADLDKWEVFAEGLDWKGNWQTSFDYKINDFVKYGATTYVCNDAHISAATDELGLENDQARWDIFNQGFDYKADWTAGTRYKLNDVVKFGPTTWIATVYHTASADFSTDTANWSKFSEGLVFEDTWNIFKEYQAGDIVRYGGNQYVAKTNHTGSIPPSSPNDWDLFSEGLKFLGPWGDDSTNFEYEIGHVVSHGAWTYRCIQDHQNQEPPNTDYWEKLNEGLRWRSEWLDDQEYLQGDVVRYGDNSYVCIKQHISEGDDFSTETETDPGGGAENSRPDLDISGTYWNIIAIGSEQSVLTTKGDLVYYSSVGPTRLPIGSNGQILTVSDSGIPEWATLGFADDVYFVAEHGVDEPAPEYGISLDRPFRTIRYATQQIERGTKVPKAARLLELNRRFIQREIVEWTEYQVANTIAPFAADFTYDSTKCERDMGFLIDAFIWDLTHGGNVRSREAALKYVNEPGQFYINGQEAETVASIQYGLTLIEKVLKQEAPDVNYQTTNGDNSTAVVTQYFETALGNQADVEYESIISGGGATTLSSSTGAGSGGGY